MNLPRRRAPRGWLTLLIIAACLIAFPPLLAIAAKVLAFTVGGALAAFVILGAAKPTPPRRR